MKSLSVIGLYFFALPSLATADATLFVSPVTGSYFNGDEVRLSVMLSSPDMPVNAAEGTLEYDSKEFHLERVDTSRSAIVSWTKMPGTDDPPGIVSFAGAFTAGRAVDREILFEIFLTPLRSGELRLRWGSGAAIHAADGTGGNIVSALSGGVYLVEPKNTVLDLPEELQTPTQEVYATTSETGEVLGTHDTASTSSNQVVDPGTGVSSAALRADDDSAKDPTQRPTNEEKEVSSGNQHAAALIGVAIHHPIIPIGVATLIVLFAMTVYFWNVSSRRHSIHNNDATRNDMPRDSFRISLK